MICKRNAIINENSKNSEFVKESEKASFMEVSDEAKSSLPKHLQSSEMIWLTQLITKKP